jgi:alkylation response protein AidB-like acyl-CoA dehydrogenase
MVGSSNAALVGAYASDEAVAEVFAGGSVPFIAGTVKAGTAQFERADGGYRVSARWGFGSGIHHAEWVMVMANGSDGSGVGMIVPRASVTIHDTWHVAGLQGTGSSVYEAADLFVPEQMSWELPYRHRRGGPGTQIPQFLVAALSAVALGLARRSLDEVVAQAKTKIRPGSTTAVAGRQHFQHVLGELEVEFRAARALRLDVTREIWNAAVAGEEVPGELWDYDNAVNAHVARVCSRVTSTTFSFGGSASASLKNPLQRNFRDMAVAGQHLQLSEQFFEVFGRARLGLAGTGDGPPSYSRFDAARAS